jgi:hypothetical protein
VSKNIERGGDECKILNVGKMPTGVKQKPR